MGFIVHVLCSTVCGFSVDGKTKVHRGTQVKHLCGPGLRPQSSLDLMLAEQSCEIHTHRPLSSSFLGLPYRIPNMNLKKEPLGSLWVITQHGHPASLDLAQEACVSMKDGLR